MKKSCDFEFKTGINAVSFLPVFYAVLMVFLTPQSSGYSGIQALRASPEFSITIYIGERKLACLCLFHHPRSGPTLLSC